MQTFETSADDSDTEVRLRLMKVRMREVGGWVLPSLCEYSSALWW